MRAHRAIIAILITLAGCGDDGGPAGPDGSVDPAPQFDDGVMQVDVRSQSFGGGQGATTVTALLSVTPAPWPYDPPTAEGACRMFVRHDIWSCTPACGPEAMCDDGACRPLPVPRSAGVLTVGGGGERRAIAFADGYALYLATALFAPGTAITASAPGADLPAFSLTATLPSPLTLVGTDQLVLAPGQALTLRWQPSGEDARIRVDLGADLGHAQWRTVVVQCDLPDAASAVTIPQPMVDVLADRENWSCGDCFGHEVRRYRRAQLPYAGTTLDLWATQSASLYLVPTR
jgi:hypothetical protein